jgi:hypothetical protein
MTQYCLFLQRQKNPDKLLTIYSYLNNKQKGNKFTGFQKYNKL